jgi:hypothetical protein
VQFHGAKSRAVQRWQIPLVGSSQPCSFSTTTPSPSQSSCVYYSQANNYAPWISSQSIVNTKRLLAYDYKKNTHIAKSLVCYFASLGCQTLPHHNDALHTLFFLDEAFLHNLSFFFWVQEVIRPRPRSESPAPRRPPPAHPMVSESSRPRTMFAGSSQSNPNQQSIVNRFWPDPNPHDHVVGGQDGIPVAIPVEGQASNLHSVVFRPAGIPTTHRPRYVWSPVTGYKLYWQPTLALRQAQRRAPAAAPRTTMAPAHAPTPTNSPIHAETGESSGGAGQFMNSVNHWAFGERLDIEDTTLVEDSGSSDDGSTTNSPTTRHTMDVTNPWGSSDNSNDGQ